MLTLPFTSIKRSIPAELDGDRKVRGVGDSEGKIKDLWGGGGVRRP